MMVNIPAMVALSQLATRNNSRPCDEKGLNSGATPVVGAEQKPTPERKPHMALKTAAQARTLTTNNQETRNTEILERVAKAIDDAIGQYQFACKVSDLPSEVVSILTKAPYLYQVSDPCADPKDQSTIFTISW